MSASWSTVEALRNDPDFLAEVEAAFAEQDEQHAEREAIRSEGAGSVRGEAPHFTCTQRITLGGFASVVSGCEWRKTEPYRPANDAVAIGIFLDGARKTRLKEKYRWGTGLPKLPPAAIPHEQLARAEALRAVGLDKRADRAEICGLMGELWECPECGRVSKSSWSCLLRSCPNCAAQIFARAFAELLVIDSYIPPSLASLPGWGWKILDFTFRHDGDFPTRPEMQKMRAVVNRTTDRAVHEKCVKWYRAGAEKVPTCLRCGSRVEKVKGQRTWLCSQCGPRKQNEWKNKSVRPRFDDDLPMMSKNGWPIASAPDGSARELVGWTVVRAGRVLKRPTCLRCCSRVKKVKGEEARLCPKCGPVEWPDWENQEVDKRRWRLRFGILHIVVSEFGYHKETGSPNFNYHFHTCFFGPFLPNIPSCARCGSLLKAKEEDDDVWNCWKCGVIREVVDGRLTQIFKEESKKLLGVESRGVWIERAKSGYRSALAHALKYTEKLPATTPGGLARYEKVLVGIRRYVVRGFLQGVPLEEQKRGAPNCSECKKPLRKIPGLGIVPLSEVEDIPSLPEERIDYEDGRKDDEVCLYELNEMAAHAPRAPC